MTTDYDTLIDGEIWAFIHKTNEFYPPDAVDHDIAWQRRAYDAMCAAFCADRPPDIDVTDTTADGVPVRVYSAGIPGRTVLYCHGGSLVFGGLQSHDDVCAEICAGTGYRVVAVDYRLLPEHTPRDAYDDVWCALKWALAEFENSVVLAGDSAGARLVSMVAHNARGRIKRIRGQVLIYPGLGGDHSAPSYTEHAHAPLLTLKDLAFAEEARKDLPGLVAGLVDAPLQDTDFTGLPPTVIFAAECDPLASDAPAYRDAIRAAGGRAHAFVEPGLVHGYLRARHMSERAANSVERIILAIEALGQGLWPYDD